MNFMHCFKHHATARRLAIGLLAGLVGVAGAVAQVTDTNLLSSDNGTARTPTP